MLTSEYHNEYFNDNIIVCSIMQYVNIGLSKWKMQSTFNILNIYSLKYIESHFLRKKYPY